MATVLAQPDSELSDCSLLYLLPRTLRSSCPAGAAMSESKELDCIGNFFKSTALKGSTELLEQAQMVRNFNHTRIPNGQNEDVENILNKRTDVDQIELQEPRDRQRRPGLLGSERMKKAFNFSAKTSNFESSQMESTGLLKRSKFSQSNLDGERDTWPVIDYSCLEHITDPVEYFSTYQKLENAEKEVQRLNGDSYLTLGKPRGRKSHQRRPGIPEANRQRSMFKFQGMIVAAMDTSSVSNSSNYTEVTNSSYSKGVNKIESSGVLALERKLIENAEIQDSEGDVDTNELEKLMSSCKELDERGIANLVQETLQIKPFNVENFRAPAVSTNLGSFQICKDAPALAGISILKRPFLLTNPKEDPFFPPNYNKQNGDACKETADSDESKSICKDTYDSGIELSQDGEGCNKIGNYVKLRPNGTDSDDVVAKLGKETVKTKLPDAEKTAGPADRTPMSQNPDLLMSISGRLAAISKLKRHLTLEKSPGSQHFIFNGDEFRDPSVSKSKEKQDGEGCNKIGNYVKLMPNGMDSDGVVAKSGKETVKTNLPDAEKTARTADRSPISQNPDLLMSISDRIAPISKLKRRMTLEKSPGSQHFVFNGDDFRDSSASKSKEKHSLSPIQITCSDGDNHNAQNASIPVLINGRKLAFEDKMQSPIDDTMGMDKYISSMNISEYPKRCLNSLLEVDAELSRPDRALYKKEFMSSVSEITLEEVGQVSGPVNCQPSKSLVTHLQKSLVNTHEHFGNPGTSADVCFHQLGNPSPAEVNIAMQEEILDVEAAKDDDLPNEMAPLDKVLETSINLPDGRNVNQEQLGASEIIENKKTRQNKRRSSLRRKSLADAGTKWESGVRRSTRIKMTPLQHWCGERFLFGRVHDSLPTVIGVKKYGTPQQDGTRAMKVKSYVSEDYAGLVVQAALH